ncbi:hypothetical protein I545_3675 [Mycobacterium kansasii 662]|uniref:Uncharacterized protein n=2 Tax=Mycobacterium kansasii TaxID=1768 RepID=A0A1V3XDV1_MYCKA|nr:hypothetical protein I547_5553 [Mycobacterium kansasii 824]EUA16839.1 hypothetical protein I545_3675 [Mycobacterium kansasii 662]KEP41717.1 hypothetical protein MKSMC1_31870 [Mycobacterium kansasii]OOK74159.1 hypothetical protein BZL30_4956 [Mycobacterium kansasii]OOK77403.1 hypothetical protein BZL29_3820 [Mycobacterium kansasii]
MPTTCFSCGIWLGAHAPLLLRGLLDRPTAVSYYGSQAGR